MNDNDSCRDHDRHRARFSRAARGLSDDLGELARELRGPARKLVRDFVDEVLGAVDRVSKDLGDLFEDVADEARGARERVSDDLRERAGRRARARAESGADSSRDEFADVLGWQPLFLEREQVCASCGVALHKGERAFLGVGASGLTGTALCAECVRS